MKKKQQQLQLKLKTNQFTKRYIPQETFQYGLDLFQKFSKPTGPNLFSRSKIFIDYVQSQKKAQLWLYTRKILTGVNSQIVAMDQYSNIVHGINFASADYLGMAQHPKAVQAAIKAASEFGVNSAGSPLALGATKYYAQLVEQLKQFWNAKQLMIYSAGWLAGFGVIKGLIRSYDHVIIDQLAHNCLQEGAKAATNNYHKVDHLDSQQMINIVKQIRQKDSETGILCITQGLFSMDSDTADLNYIQRQCKKYNAYMLLDCAHDFGCMGQNGKGTWENQKLKDRSNVIMIGTGSKCLSTNIGFAACEDPMPIQYLKVFSTAYLFTNAINPVQAATSLANLRILGSYEGKMRRKKVLQNYLYLKEKLQQTGNKIFGNPCPILPLLVGNEFVCRLVCRLMFDNGIHVNGIQFPVVKLGEARLRVNMMPQHTKQHLDTFVQIFNLCKVQATKIFQQSIKKYQNKVRLNSRL